MNSTIRVSFTEQHEKKPALLAPCIILIIELNIYINLFKNNNNNIIYLKCCRLN